MSVAWRKLRKDILDTCNKYNNVLIMVSGGVDSMFLLNFVVRAGITPTVIHFKHGIRNDDHNEMKLVTEYCNKHSLLLHTGEGKGLMDIKNQECVARGQRWGFVESIISDLNGSTIVLTAHHYNDQIENFLMASARGRPLSSLTMKTVSHFDVYDKYKPLLDVTKDEIYKQCRQRKISFIEDPTNQDLDHERNIFRNKIIPDMMTTRNLEKSMRSLFKELSQF